MSDMAIIAIVVVIGLLMAGVLFIGQRFISQQRRTGSAQLIGGGIGDIVTGAFGFADLEGIGSSQTQMGAA
jgi:uncharacterized membrane protein YqiK